MKRLLGALLFAVLVQAFPAQAQWADGNQLKNLGYASQRLDQDRFDIGDPPKEAQFQGYLQGVMDAKVSASEQFCLPPRMKLGQIQAVVIKYLNDHPEQLHLSGDALVTSALMRAFPCTRAQQEAEEVKRIYDYLGGINDKLYADTKTLENIIKNPFPDDTKDRRFAYDRVQSMKDHFSLLREFVGIHTEMEATNDRRNISFYILMKKGRSISAAKIVVELINEALLQIRPPAAAVNAQTIRDYIQEAIEKLEAWNP